MIDLASSPAAGGTCRRGLWPTATQTGPVVQLSEHSLTLTVQQACLSDQALSLVSALPLISQPTLMCLSVPDRWCGAHRWFSYLMAGLATFAWNGIKSFVQNLVETHPWALIEATKQNNVDSLRVRQCYSCHTA